MGQYYKIVNLDKKEFITPHEFGDGPKLLEFGTSSGGAMMALAILLADGNGRGGGDLKSNDTEYVGRWKGDRIIIAGDYADPLNFIPSKDKRRLQKVANAVYTMGYREWKRVPLYHWAGAHFQDISKNVRNVLQDAGEFSR